MIDNVLAGGAFFVAGVIGACRAFAGSWRGTERARADDPLKAPSWWGEKRLGDNAQPALWRSPGILEILAARDLG